MKRLLCIWLPNWPVQRLVVERPELKQRTIVLYERQPRRGDCVAACCSEASQAGVRVNMPLAEAASLAGGTVAGVERSKPSAAPGSATRTLFLARHHPDADRAALEKLAERCQQFSPLVSLEIAPRPQSLLLDVTGLDSLFGGEESLICAVTTDLQQIGYYSRVAIADTLGAAWAVAHYGAKKRTDPICRNDSESAARKLDPSLLLSPLPVEALRLMDDTVELLHQLGIFQIGQLLELPRVALPSRLGEELLLRLDQAMGEAEEILVPHRPPPEFSAELCLEHPTAHRDTIQHIAAKLIEHVAARLVQENQGAIELTCRLDCAGGRPATISVGLYEPTAAPQYLLGLLRMQLDLLALQGAVQRVSITATITAPLARQQGDLFDNPARHHPRQLALFVDQLSSRLGRERVVRPMLEAAALPERAYRYDSLAGKRVEKSKSRKVEESKSQRAEESKAPLVRPLQLKFPPVPLAVVAVAEDGPPAVFHWQNQRHEVAGYWGPERIETAWWRGETVRRDYYRVATIDGQRFWLFRRLQDGKWFLHGEFV